MSIRIMTQVWDHGPEDQGQLLVLLAMADFADDAGRCWPSLARIAEKARMSDRNVRRVIRKLEYQGYLKTDVSSGRSTNIYHILCNPDNLSAPSQPGHLRPPTRTNDALNPDICDTNPDIAMSAEPSIEPSRTVKEPSTREILCSVLRQETADDFIAHRKAMKKPVTPEAARRLIAKVKNHPYPDAVFDESIANGWQGIFPERKSNERPSARPTGADIATRAAERWAARQLDSGSRPGSSQPLLPARQSDGRNGNGD